MARGSGVESEYTHKTKGAFKRIYVMIYDRAKFECGKWRATFTATTYAEAVPVPLPMWSTVNGGLPLPALPFLRVV